LIKSKYHSSGVLIIIPASGGGNFGAVFDDVTANIKGVMSAKDKPNGTFLRVESLALDLNIKKVKLQVSKIFNNNKILSNFLIFSVISYCFNLVIFSRRCHKSLPERKWPRDLESYAASTPKETFQ
jgi:hypothetical protein